MPLCRCVRRSSRDRGASDGLLPLQQRGRGRALCAKSLFRNPSVLPSIDWDFHNGNGTRGCCFTTNQQYSFFQLINIPGIPEPEPEANMGWAEALAPAECTLARAHARNRTEAYV